ncbi:MAG: PAS domain-containing sensor histidine kinase [Alteromonadaceae bacterium]|nr:PAS domain-containing sensor histidine kinase [Alteromonadaceae bacterium]
MYQIQSLPTESVNKSGDRNANAAADANNKVTALFRQEGRPGALSTAVTEQRSEGLQRETVEAPVDEALDLFNRMSRQITDSYRTLESRVNQLSGELSNEARERQRQLEEKERIADRLTTLLEAMPAGVVVLDSQGVVSQCNPAARELLGEPLENQRWLDIIQRSFSPRRDDGHEVSLRDGRRVSIEIRSMGHEPGQLIVLTDLTHTRQLQTQLARSERLSSMGRMVASLAHQVRTPLSAAMLYAGHLCQSDLDENLRKRCADKLMARLAHLEHQVRDMLIFARGETRLAETRQVGDLVEQLESAAESTLRNQGATLEIEYAEGRDEDAWVLCNREALVGALMNLVNNSLEAGGKTLSLAVSRTNAQVVIQLVDNGCGFAQETSTRLVEAFHTTKAHGTGLGLAVVTAVLKAHGGQFQLESSGQGATATVVLPIHAAGERI